MADEILKRDDNRAIVDGAVTNDAAMEVRNLRVSPSTNSLLTSLGEYISGENPTDFLLETAHKPINSISESLSWDTSAALEKSSISSTIQGNVYTAFGINNSGSTRYFQLFDSTTLPADATIPNLVVQVPAGQQFSLDLSEFGKYFSLGIVWCSSTTLATKTITGSNDMWVHLGYKS